MFTSNCFLVNVNSVYAGIIVNNVMIVSESIDLQYTDAWLY